MSGATVAGHPYLSLHSFNNREVTTMLEEIWRKPKVLAAIGMGNTWLYEAVERGDFPKPVKLGSRAVGWRKSDVQAWLEHFPLKRSR